MTDAPSKPKNVRDLPKLARRININYALVQFFFWAAYNAYAGYSTVFLGYRGLTDTHIGATVALTSAIAIAMQLFLSSFSDKHAAIPLKRTLTALFVAAMAICAVMFALPVPLAMLAVVFAVGNACNQSINGLLNAQMMQYSNRRVPVTYGWPRGCGSMGYALTAYVVGILLERFSPNAIMPVYFAMCFLSVTALMALPNPARLAPPLQDSGDSSAELEHTSYREMLSGNPTLLLLLAACSVSYVGQVSSMTFLIRIVEEVGGSTKELGAAMFVQCIAELPTLFISGWILRRAKSKHILLASLFAYTARALGFALSSSLPGVYAAISLSIFCFGLYGFSSVIFVNGIVSGAEKVRAQSLVILCTAGLGGIAGNFMAGYVIDHYGLPVVLHLSWAFCLAGALLMVVCCRVHTKYFPEEA